MKSKPITNKLDNMKTNLAHLKLLLLCAVIFMATGAYSQVVAQDMKTVSGTVTSAGDGMPLPGVNVFVKETNYATVTDFNGNFSLEVPTSSTLTISYVGFVTKTIEVSSGSNFNVVLETDVEALNEIVVVGYGTVKKTDLTGAVGSLDGEKLTHMESNGKLIEADEKYLRERRSKIGMVFQQFNLFPHMTALQNCIEAPVEVLGMKKEEAEERALELLELVGLTDKKDQHPSRLSGGQQQRVAIARALAMRPKVMLLDEITSALDPEVVGEVLNVIRSLNKEHNLTMIMVTHQMGFAREISDRVCFFNEGKIFEQGPPEKLFGDPQNERTKQFLHAVLDAN